jgi:hypothetical protein
MAIFGPKNYRIELGEPDLVYRNEIYKYLEYLQAI